MSEHTTIVDTIESIVYNVARNVNNEKVEEALKFLSENSLPADEPKPLLMTNISDVYKAAAQTVIDLPQLPCSSEGIPCVVCGVVSPSYRIWLLHHLESTHIQMVTWLTKFRSECIDNMDEEVDAETIGDPAELEAAVQHLTYCQELFIGPDQSSLVCGVCCMTVDNLREHVSSVQHDEAYLSVLYGQKSLEAKRKFGVFGSKVLNLDMYQRRIRAVLEKELPPTVESPLEMVPVKGDKAFWDWLEKFMSAINVIRQHNAAYVKADTKIEEELFKSPTLLNQRSCEVCQTTHFSLEAWENHRKQDSHLSKIPAYDFLQHSEEYETIDGESVGDLQKTIMSQGKSFIGVDSICYFPHLPDPFSESRLWICNICCVHRRAKDADLISSSIQDHLGSVRHKKNIIDRDYSDVKPVAKSVHQMNAEVERLCEEIVEENGIKSVTALKLATGDTPYFAALMKACDSQDVTPNKTTEQVNGNSQNSAEAVSTDDECVILEEPKKPAIPEPELNIIDSTEHYDLLWCDACWVVIVVQKSRTDALTVWKQHVARPIHKNKIIARGKIANLSEAPIIKKSSFMNDVVSKMHLNEVAGLKYVFERQASNTAGVEYVCTLCAEVMDSNVCIKHLISRLHMYQYLHKQYPEKVPELLCATAKTAAERDADIMKFMKTQVYPFTKQETIRCVGKPGEVVEPEPEENSLSNGTSNDDKTKSPGAASRNGADSSTAAGGGALSPATTVDVSSSSSTSSTAPPPTAAAPQTECDGIFVVNPDDDGKTPKTTVFLSEAQRRWFRHARHTALCSTDCERLTRLAWEPDAAPLAAAPNLAKSSLLASLKKDVLRRDRQLRKIQQTSLNAILPIMYAYNCLPADAKEAKKDLKLAMGLLMASSHRMDEHRLENITTPAAAASSVHGDKPVGKQGKSDPPAGRIRSTVCHLVENDLSREPNVLDNIEISQMKAPEWLIQKRKIEKGGGSGSSGLSQKTIYQNVASKRSGNGGGQGSGSNSGGQLHSCYNYQTGKMGPSDDTTRARTGSSPSRRSSERSEDGSRPGPTKRAAPPSLMGGGSWQSSGNHGAKRHRK